MYIPAGPMGEFDGPQHICVIQWVGLTCSGGTVTIYGGEGGEVCKAYSTSLVSVYVRVCVCGCRCAR